MALGRQRERRSEMLVSWSEMPRSPGHAFYDRLQAELVTAGFDGFVEELVAARHPDATVIIPPRSSAVPSAAAETAPTQRDAHLRCIAECGRMGWQRASGYNWRALVEADVSRWKRVIGDGLH